MSVVNGRRVIAASLVLIFIWLIPAVAQASVTSVAISAPVSITAGSSSPICVLAQDNGVPVPGTSVTVSLIGPGSVTPATAVTNGSGYASFTLNALTVTGILTLTASSGGATAMADVPVVAAPPARLDILSPPGLLPADGYCTYQLIARAQDRYGNGCAGWPVNITVDGTAYVATADTNGDASFIVGPTFSKHKYNVVADANGHSGSVQVRFLVANLYLLSYPSSVPAGQTVSITALLLDDLTEAPGILLTFEVYSPNNLADPSSFAGYTDANGRVTFTFKTSPTSGLNTIIIGNQSLGGDLRYASVRGTGGQVSQIILTSDPTPADGSTHSILKMWAKDSGGNPVKNEGLTVVRNYAENFSVTTNTNGYAEIDAGSTPYVGMVHFDVTAQNGVTNSCYISYVAGPPARTVIKAVPNVIASSDVPQPPNMADVHMTELVAQVTDQWYHPLPGYDINVISLNTTAGTIVGPTSGITDSNGEFYTQFRLGNQCPGNGTVNIRAVSDTLSSTYPITYTNTAFLSVDTTITPRNVSVNGTINVDISIKGLGWNNRPQPVDMILITDRSGSMDWYSTYLYPTTGIPQTGTMATGNHEYLIATYDNPSGNKYLQFMLSSPYSNYLKGSYYNYLRVVDPSGHSHDGTNSANENYYQTTSGTTGTYKVYARASYTADGGTPPYSYAVLTLPKRLGSPWVDNGSAAKMAATQLANNMTYMDQMGLVSFSTTATLNAGLKIINGSNKTKLLNAISGLDANGGTEVFTGIHQARDEFAANGRSSVKHVAILLSDGYSQSPANDLTEANAAKNDGIIIFTIGMGMADGTNLGAIANITGGQYYHVASDMELAERYQQIFKSVSDIVAKDSAMDIITTRSTVNGTLMNDTQYIPGSAIVTFVNGTSAHVEPVITCDADNYTLSWDPGAINCNQIWEVNYQVKAMHGGIITPISNRSFISFTTSDDKTGTIPFDADSIFCQDNLNGHIGIASPGLQIHITSPVNGTITDQLRLSVSWLVGYSGNDTYTQRVSILPMDEDKWMDVARGFEGDRNSTGGYSFWWNMERVPTGNYTVQVFVTDGTYDAQDQVTISIPYRSGQIVLQ